MDSLFEPRQAARFLRTLRVATGVALAREDLRRGGAAPAARFQALAAKTGAWRFPDEGLLSADGLLLATRTRTADGAGTLTLQAQGAAGLSVYGGRAARVGAGEGYIGEGEFDRFGALRLDLTADAIDDAELAGLEVELIAP